jgi:hypothetical protein
VKPFSAVYLEPYESHIRHFVVLLTLHALLVSIEALACSLAQKATFSDKQTNKQANNPRTLRMPCVVSKWPLSTAGWFQAHACLQEIAPSTTTQITNPGIHRMLKRINKVQQIHLQGCAKK